MAISHNSLGRSVEQLTTAECWRFLENRTIGRLAVEGPGGVPDLFPVNYRVSDGCVYFRSAPGSKLMDIASRSAVAFEIDGEDSVTHWSVVIKGTARRLDVDAEIHASGVDKLVSASPTVKEDFVCIVASSVTGRRFRKRIPDVEAAAAPSRAATSTGSHEPVRPPESEGESPGRTTAPIPIPHFPPRPTP